MIFLRVVFSFFFLTTFALAMDDSCCDDKPITSAMIKEGLQTYPTYQTKQKSDLSGLAREKKYEEAEKTANSFALQKIRLPLKDGKEMPLLLVNWFSGYMGTFEIHEWDESLSDTKNFEVVNQCFYKIGIRGVLRNAEWSRLCTNVTYRCDKPYGNSICSYKDGEGYFQTDRSHNPLWLCTVQHIGTQEKYQNLGIGKLAIAEVVKFLFNTTSIEFINASIKDFRVPSRRTFISNGFVETKTIDKPDQPNYKEAKKVKENMETFMSLDNGQSWINPSFFGGSANFYLTREKWANKPLLNTNDQQNL